eukprot:CAMPEP_0119366834 /NCGR_PEP_ID=MMETSP1334-20130426/13661_1 /TAXON_ID=127549 /ORGANISM="Calcidiscus leptoporus, Strain RCC1130" /LENGTH=37 /DNA_ID= /DNA_START= /DNA_END= /DNA_ORIENTATION=
MFFAMHTLDSAWQPEGSDPQARVAIEEVLHACSLTGY